MNTPRASVSLVLKPSMRSSLPVLFVVCLTARCGASDRSESPEAVFRSWNAAAVVGDTSAEMFVCSNPSGDDSYDSPVSEHSAGFKAALAAPLNVNVDGASAVVDFTDPGTSAEEQPEDVFVSLIKERGDWKVCRVQITAAGGFG